MTFLGFSAGSGHLVIINQNWKVIWRGMFIACLYFTFLDSGSAQPVDDLSRIRFDRHGDLLPVGAIQRIGTSRLRHGSRILSLTFSPAGETLAAGGGNDPIRIWSTKTGKQIIQIAERWVHALAFSPDGRTLATGGGFKSVRLWNVSTGKLLSEIKGHDRTVRSVAWSPNGRFLASASGNTVRVWNPQLKRDVFLFQGHKGEITSLAISQDNRFLASGSQDNTVRLWDLGDGKVVGVCDVINGAGCVAFIGGGKRFAVGEGNGDVSVWNVETKKRLGRFAAHKDSVLALASNKDGTKILTSSYGGALRCWTANGKLDATFDSGRISEFDAIAFSQDGKLAATAGRNNTIKMWDAATGKRKQLPGAGQHGGITSLSRSSCGKWLAFADTTNMAYLVDAKTGKTKFTWRLSSVGAVRLSFSPDGKQLAVAAGESLQVKDVLTGKDAAPLLPVKGDEVLCLHYAPDGKRIAAAYGHSGLRLWNVQTGRIERLIPIQEGVRELAFSPGGKLLAAASITGIRFWDVTSGQLTRQVSKKHPATSIAFAPDGKTIASGHFDSIIRLWDPATGTQIRTLNGHQSAVYSLSFSPTGRMLASGGFDNTVRVWEIASGEPVSAWKGHAGTVRQVAMSADGRKTYSGSADTSVLVWDVTDYIHRGGFPAVKSDKAHMELEWRDLASKSGSTGMKAAWSLVAGGNTAIKFLQERVYLPGRAEVEKLISELNDDSFTVRETATAKLRGYGQWIRGRLEEATKKPASLEVKLRLDDLLRKLDAKGAVTIQQERFRLKRVMEVLEQSGTKQARRLLVLISRGAVETALAEEALASLRRVDKKRVE